MLHSLRIQLGALVFGVVALLAGSIAVTFLAIRTQADNGTLINLAGRQSMLTQQMTWLAFTQPDSSALADSILLFDQTLRVLRNGGTGVNTAGQVVTLPPAPDADLRARLDTVAQTWAAFRVHLLQADAAAVQSESPRIREQLDAIVGRFDAHSQAEMSRLHLIQLTLFGAAVALLIAGYFITRRRFVTPMVTLSQAANRMAAGQLDEPVHVTGNDEFAQLARAFETMRAEVATVHEQLEARIMQRTRELATAFQFSQEIVAQLDLDHLLNSVTDHARTLTRAEAVSLCLLDEHQTELILSASSGHGLTPLELHQPVWQFPASVVVGTGQTIVTETACSNCGFMRSHAPGHCVAAPLRAGNRTLGALCVVRSGGARFDPDETRALTLLANSAAVAITNARLVETERRQAEQTATLAERERLAAEFHDHLAQTLSFLSFKADLLRETLVDRQMDRAQAELQRMKTALDEAYRQVRAALVGLSEPAPNADDLAAKLAACLAEFREASGLSAELVIGDASALILPRVAQTQALLIVREALTNIRRHAQARKVWVRVERDREESCFTVEDDGRGFDASATESDNHLGLTIMQARAERSGGYLTVDSMPGAGTRVTAHFLLKTPSPEGVRVERES